MTLDQLPVGKTAMIRSVGGAGALRRLDEKSLDEIHRIFEVSGGKEMFDAIEEHSDRKARELGYEEGADQKYMMDVFLNNSNEHY